MFAKTLPNILGRVGLPDSANIKTQIKFEFQIQTMALAIMNHKAGCTQQRFHCNMAALQRTAEATPGLDGQRKLGKNEWRNW